MTKIDRLIVHCGFAKTGTSALQSHLLANKEALFQQGFLYPGARENHFHLQTAFAREPHKLVQVVRDGISDPSQFAIDYRESIATEVLGTTAHTAIISSEYFTSMDDAELKALGRYFHSMAEAVELHIYVRDPWSYSVSYTQQKIRDGTHVERFEYERGGMQLRRMASTLDAPMAVRAYFPGLDIVSDFAEWIGADFPVTLPRENASAGAETARLLNELNRRFPRYDQTGAFIASPVRDWMAEAIENATPDDRPIRLSQGAADRIFAAAKSDLRLIQQWFFDGRPVFTGYYEQASFTGSDDRLDDLGPDALASLFRALAFASERGLSMREWALHEQSSRRLEAS